MRLLLACSWVATTALMTTSFLILATMLITTLAGKCLLQHDLRFRGDSQQFHIKMKHTTVRKYECHKKSIKRNVCHGSALSMTCIKDTIDRNVHNV